MLVPESFPEADPETLLSEGLQDLSQSPTLESSGSARIRILIQRMPKSFDHEFGLLLVDGRISRAFLVSTAVEGKAPILGTYRLGIPRVKGKPWPWRTSIKYQNSPMYWALQIDGGYFIHSTPHYGNLGAPASMGCIRASLPDAMELFDAVANRGGSAGGVITLREGLDLSRDDAVSREFRQALERSGWSKEDLDRALDKSRSEIEAVSRGDLEYAPGVPVDAHPRPFSESLESSRSYPLCAGSDCWKLYRREPRILRLKPNVQLLNPSVTEYSDGFTGPARLARGAVLVLDPSLGGAIGSLDPFLIDDVELGLRSGGVPLKVRICERESGICSKPRGPIANEAGVFLYPLYQISQKLKSSSGLFLEVVEGEGFLESLRVRYFN
jgi:hypothetical protein